MPLDRGMYRLSCEVDPTALVLGGDGRGVVLPTEKSCVQMSVSNLIPHITIAGEKYASK